MEAIQGYQYYPAYQTVANPYQAPQPQAQKTMSGASAVTINIIEPKAYAGSEPQQGFYSYPQASVYAPQPGAYPPPPVAMPPVYPYQFMPVAGTLPQTMMPAQVPLTGTMMPPPPLMPLPEMLPPAPQPVINQLPNVPMPMPAPPAPPAPPVPPVPPVAPQQPELAQTPPSAPPVQPENAAPPVAPQPEAPQQPQIPPLSANDLPAINAALIQGDENVKAAALEAIARIGQGNEETYNNLLGLLKQDTSKLNGDAKTLAQDNKKHAIWTLAILNKNQNPQVPFLELPGIKDEMGNILKSDPDPEMRKSVILAYDFLRKPEDSNLLTKLLTVSATQDKNADVNDKAKEVLEKIQKEQSGAPAA